MSGDEIDPSEAVNDQEHNLRPVSPYWPSGLVTLWGKTAILDDYRSLPTSVLGSNLT